MAKILLVEDNELSQKMMFYTLRHAGIEADVASDGQEAVDMVISNAYELILMDIQLPVFDGYEATRQIRYHEFAEGKHSFIIGLTSNVYDQEREKCIAAGMDEYMTKPFDIVLFKDLAASHGFQF